MRVLNRLTRCIITAVVFQCVSVHPGAAQGSRSPNTPSLPHERLAVFEGTWTLADSQSGPASRDSCAWLAEGRRHMICRRRSESPRGASEQMMIYSYRRSDSMYTVTVLLAGGQIWRYAGRAGADSWEFLLEPTGSDVQQRLRQVVRVVGDTLHFREEGSGNGGPWLLTAPTEDYKSVKARTAADPLPKQRVVTATVGIGNAMGWFGGQAEKYLGAGTVSLFGGLGYTPPIDAGDAHGVTAAVGMRAYTSGFRHRGFAEVSFSQLAVEAACFADCRRLYGPGFQVGYQYAARGGFTLLVSLGVGYALGTRDGQQKVGELAGLGVGYTWRR